MIIVLFYVKIYNISILTCRDYLNWDTTQKQRILQSLHRVADPNLKKNSLVQFYILGHGTRKKRSTDKMFYRIISPYIIR